MFLSHEAGRFYYAHITSNLLKFEQLNFIPIYANTNLCNLIPNRATHHIQLQIYVITYSISITLSHLKFVLWFGQITQRNILQQQVYVTLYMCLEKVYATMLKPRSNLRCSKTAFNYYIHTQEGRGEFIKIPTQGNMGGGGLCQCKRSHKNFFNSITITEATGNNSRIFACFHQNSSVD